MEEAKKIFFPAGKSGYAKACELDLCECSLGNFTGHPLPLNDSNFSISQYLADNSLFASRVRFYLLTTLKDQDALDNISTRYESVEQRTPNLSSSDETKCSNDDGVGHAADSGVEQEASESILHVDDSKKSLVIEFCRHVISQYRSDASSQCVIGWADCYSSRSSKFLECEANEYHPCDDNFIVWSISVDANVYVRPDINKDDSLQIMQDTYSFPMHDFETSNEPLILHQPNELHGYDSDNTLFLAVVTNFHNAIGVTYTWFVNDDVCANGSSHCVIRVTSPGIYRCEIQYGDIKLSTNAVEVFKQKCLRYELAILQG